MNFTNHTFLLRFAISVVLLAHSVPTMLTGTIQDFGELYLNQVGFAPLGIPIAWSVKLSHLICAICLLFEEHIKIVLKNIFIVVNILILIMGIVMLHFAEGWFVVGGGRNGMEFNFILIFVLLSLLFPNGLKKA